MNYGFGVDVGGTTIKLGYFDTDGNMLDKWVIPTNTADNGRSVLPDISSSLESYIAGKKLERSSIIGIGLGIPGPVTDDGVVHTCVNLGWGMFNVEDELKRLTGFRVKASNDANAAALGEMWRGGAEGHNSLFMVTLGTGIGCGIILNGRLLTGVHGAAGEFGHMPVHRIERRICGCGKSNCLESYASGIGFANTGKLRTAGYEGETMLRGFDPISAKDIFDCAAAGDSLSLELVDELGMLLGEALSVATGICDPGLIVLGGGVSHAGQPLIDVIKKHFLKTAFHACRDTQFVLATLGGDAGKYGAMKLLLQ